MGMNPRIKTAGGGSARPVGDAFQNFLLNNLNSGQFQQMMTGANNPANQFAPLSWNTQNFQTSADMNDPQFAALAQMQARNMQQDVGGLRERFSMGGGLSRGTPAAVAEGNYRAAAQPQNILAMGELANQMRGQQRADLALGQQDAIQRMQLANQQAGMNQDMVRALMDAYRQSTSIGIPQAQNFMQPSGFSQAMGALSGIAPFALAPFTGGASLGLGGLAGGGGFTNPFAGLFGGGDMSKMAAAGMNMRPSMPYTPQFNPGSYMNMQFGNPVLRG